MAANVSTDTVRYYEKQGLMSPPERPHNGYRLHTEAHAGALRFGWWLKPLTAARP